MGDAAWDGGGYCSGVEIYYRMVGDVRLFGLIEGDTVGVASGYCRGGGGCCKGVKHTARVKGIILAWLLPEEALNKRI